MHMHTYVLYIYIVYSQTFLNRPTVGPTLNGPFREIIGIGNYNIITLLYRQ